uniref:Subtilisin n=1 Tax=Pseudictyota dubia TaxID=2749911 RepID=A0A7R9W3M6_9STRA|mmetsp:Transcript_30973/g.57257  ORF Transcript_30973/g.57257 Transcript_30973/m.57257 type:complete len:307 (+) Transcript_30973:110-1030(+)|eukprot:CAMPEP_0197456826 /NCGR_PEP_ID=MMETSP1175-20131217/44370_1 /TAXON_ID=1003142 /ORGANISM="Triceratium dubium, Strain CCMP147" /LENGTH=306 /DNA_ID=CAMNT_0042991009 /DNA_START=110 /DNA_END=1030 /DNA_ORIENTATION=+
MMRFTSISLGLFAAFAANSGADASTTVAVIEIGAGGVARRTTSPSAKTSVPAVSSFWNSMHDVDEKRRRAQSLQYPGMTVVPDLFKRADGGVVIGITGRGVDLAEMPSISNLVEKESVGHFRLSGLQGSALMEKTGKAHEVVDSHVLKSSIEKKVKNAASGGNKLGALSVSVNDKESAGAVDDHVSNSLSSLQKYATETGSTIVVHLVVEEEDGYPRRRLEDQQDQENEEEEGDNDNQDNNGNWNNYNYEDNEGDKTIFQIQYFNIVLWTSVALIVLVTFTIWLTVAMPLEPDTLLFGESAKVVGE